MTPAERRHNIIFQEVARIKRRLRRKTASLEGNKVLVTGGAGFLGSWICDSLVALGLDVLCLDDLSTGKTENIQHLMGSQRFSFRDCDVAHQLHDWKELEAKFILHMASHASPEEYQMRPIETLKVNSLGSFNMLELARKSDATLLFTSTSEVYGDAGEIPTPENYWGNVNPIGPRSCYDEGKRFAEALCMAYSRTYGLKIRIARIFNTYGPRIRPDGVYARALPRFVSQALDGKPITVYGEGSQTRSFCYVADTVLGLLLLLLHENSDGEVFNIGNPHEISILELAQQIKSLTHSNSPITFHPLPVDDPQRRCPDISKTRHLLGWNPETSLRQGLEKTIAWLKPQYIHPSDPRGSTLETELQPPAQ